MNERWKIPVAYFFINSLTGLQKSKLLLDCIRRLQSIGVVVSSLIDYKNRTISWQYIVELNKLQTKEGLNFANRLRTKHVQYKGQKMKVHFATQLFSKSVADLSQNGIAPVSGFRRH